LRSLRAERILKTEKVAIENLKRPGCKDEYITRISCICVFGAVGVAFSFAIDALTWVGLL
jgi:hypothetical protein